MNDSENTKAAVLPSRSTDGLGGPTPDAECGLCKPDCPMLAKWDHPFWNHTAWCWHLMQDLQWYDYWLADCLRSEPDGKLVRMRNVGRTPPPNAK